VEAVRREEVNLQSTVGRFSETGRFVSPDWKSDGVMDENISELTKEEVNSAGMEKLEWGWQRDTGSWFQKQGEHNEKSDHL